MNQREDDAYNVYEKREEEKEGERGKKQGITK